MSDEVASATLQTSQKAIEVALELIKLLAPLAEKFIAEMYHKSVDGVNFVGNKVASVIAAGTVSNKALISEAQKANSPISSTSNFLARDAERIAEKAKQYKIPVAIIGNGEKQTVEFLDRDKAVMEQIFSEVMQERINGLWVVKTGKSLAFIPPKMRNRWQSSRKITRKCTMRSRSIVK